MAKKLKKQTEDSEDDDVQSSDLEDGDILEAGDEEEEEDLGELDKEEELTTITVDGKEFQVDAELAEAINNRTRRSGPKPRADEEPITRKTKTDEDDPLEGIEEQLFTDPKAALTRYGEHVANSVKKEIKAEYISEKKQELFWNNFYEHNDDLKKSKSLVKAVMSDHMDELENMSIDDVYDRLGDLTRQEVSVLSKSKKKSRKRMRSESLEGGDRKVTQKKEDDDEEDTKENEITNLTDIIKRRRQQRVSGSTRTTVA